MKKSKSGQGKGEMTLVRDEQGGHQVCRPAVSARRRPPARGIAAEARSGACVVSLRKGGGHCDRIEWPCPVPTGPDRQRVGSSGCVKHAGKPLEGISKEFQFFGSSEDASAPCWEGARDVTR